MRVATLALILFGLAGTAEAQAARTEPSPSPTPSMSEGFLQGVPALRDSLSGSAREQYDAARLLLDDHDYSGALIKFRQAFELSGEVRLLWNLAACEKNLRHYARALGLLDRYRAEVSARMTSAHRAELAELEEALRAFVSRVRIEVNESDASVYVDDELLGRTPLSEQQLLDLGKHALRVTKPGFSEAQLSQQLAGGSELTIHVNLQPLPPAPPLPRLSVSSAADAVIWIDGQRMGQAQWSGELPEGPHALRVSAVGMLDHEQSLNLHAGDSRALQVTLKERPSSISPLVWAGAGVVVASGLAVGGYFLFRGSPDRTPPYVGSLEPPGTVRLP